MLLLPKEIWDEVAVQSLNLDVEQIFETGKMGSSFEELMIAHKYDEANRMWCVRQFVLLHLPPLIKKAHTKDLNKFWFVDFLEKRRIKYKDPLSVTFCSEIINNLRLGSSRDWFHEVWDKALDEWILEQPKEKDFREIEISARFLRNMEEYFVLRPEYINWINPYSIWVSEKICIPHLSIDSFIMWLHEEEETVIPRPFLYLYNDAHGNRISVTIRYARGLHRHFPFVHNKKFYKDRNAGVAFHYYDHLKEMYDVMWEMMDIFWGEDKKRPLADRLFENTPMFNWLVKTTGGFNPYDIYG
jgi:hypothetical protein